MENKNIFISYKNDGEGNNFGAILCSYLEEMGYDVYFNLNERSAGDFPERLRKHVEACVDFLLVVTKPCLEQLKKHEKVDWIREELLLAHKSGKNIVPLLMPGVDFPKDKDEMPEDLSFLPHKEAIKMFEPYNKSPLECLVGCIKSVPNKNKQRSFEINEERGLMFNREDNQRNISFRADTLINSFSIIFEEVSSLINDTEKVSEIFFSSGYSSGKRFADRINDQWPYGNSFNEVKEKLNKWCNFDSSVGWGRFFIDFDYNEETDSVGGVLRIEEAFLVDRNNKHNICNYIKGYCTGVIEVFVRSAKIELVCKECPMKSCFKTACVFEIKTKGI